MMDDPKYFTYENRNHYDKAIALRQQRISRQYNIMAQAAIIRDLSCRISVEIARAQADGRPINTEWIEDLCAKQESALKDLEGYAKNSGDGV